MCGKHYFVMLLCFNLPCQSFFSIAKLDLLDVFNDLVVFVSSLSLCINLSVMELKLVSLELVLRYRFVSPLCYCFNGCGHRVVCCF